ncbi:MFS general substrate transporter [Macrolepiota fuliginosa MF-IS2]|uniref:MFS general substrate transporter n=1 Tax=Macrolepiota fuliginosa MF-IS2 TaxID=1400762 RepID=A0A9P5XNA7_9AGAR|nr:MFS general substrate transporter [Macrolepiota fuliginosa MF-IS2]
MVDDELMAQDERAPFLVRDDVESTPRRTPLPLTQLLILLFIHFCESASAHSLFPFINELLLSLVGGDQAKVTYSAGIMDAAQHLASFSAVMYWGRVSDYVGRKPVLLISAAAVTVSILLLGISTTFWMVVVSRCIFGGLNSYQVTIKTTVGEMTDNTNRADAFALLYVPWALGLSIGPLIGGTLSNPQTRFPDLFSGKLWKDFPYLLPCGILTLLSFLAFLILFAYFQETLPHKSNISISLEPHLTTPQHPPPLRALLTPRVLLSISNYISLALLSNAYLAIQPLFLNMPIQTGGLGLEPIQIGYILSFYGFYSAVVQVLLLGPTVRRFGQRTVLKFAVSAIIPIYLLFPLMNIYAKDWYIHSELGGNPNEHINSRRIMYTLLAIQLVLLSIMDLGYGCAFMFITTSAPTKRSLGTVNGMAQTAGSVARLIGPGFANVMLGLSIEKGWLGGYAVYFVMSFFAVGGVVLAKMLPEGAWDAADWEES